MVYPLWKTVWWFLTKLNILLPYNPAIKLLSIYPHGFKTFVHARTCMWIFIAALFIIAKAWKQPMKRQGRHLNIYYWVKTVYLKRLHIA